MQRGEGSAGNGQCGREGKTEVGRRLSSRGQGWDLYVCGQRRSSAAAARGGEGKIWIYVGTEGAETGGGGGLGGEGKGIGGGRGQGRA